MRENVSVRTWILEVLLLSTIQMKDGWRMLLLKVEFNEEDEGFFVLMISLSQHVPSM